MIFEAFVLVGARKAFCFSFNLFGYFCIITVSSKLSGHASIKLSKYKNINHSMPSLTILKFKQTNYAYVTLRQKN